MVNIAVKCIDNKDAANKYFGIVHALRDLGLDHRLNRLIYHQLIVGDKNCKIRFYSSKDCTDLTGIKVDVSYGFSIKEQRNILNEGSKISRKFVDFRDDFTEELVKYFVDSWQQ